jgi:hypothetical protein
VQVLSRDNESCRRKSIGRRLLSRPFGRLCATTRHRPDVRSAHSSIGGADGDAPTILTVASEVSAASAFGLHRSHDKAAQKTKAFALPPLRSAHECQAARFSVRSLIHLMLDAARRNAPLRVPLPREGDRVFYNSRVKKPQ